MDIKKPETRLFNEIIRNQRIKKTYNNCFKLSNKNLINPEIQSNCSSNKKSQYSEQQSLYEGGEDDYDDDQRGENEDEIDPDDPYQINRINEIPHEHLKELYTQVVDELLDIQLEFEEKLEEAEENAKADHEALVAEKEAVVKEKEDKIDELTVDLDRHKQALAKLSERLKSNAEQIATLRQQNASAPAAKETVPSAVSSADLLALKDQIQQLQEELQEEKNAGMKTEEQFSDFKNKIKKQEEKFKENQQILAQTEIENDELKNQLRELGYTIEDLEQKLDSQLEINELLSTEQEEQRGYYEEQLERQRQQLQENTLELQEKEKELKKLKFNQLIQDTQQTFQMIDKNQRLNQSMRHAHSVYAAPSKKQDLKIDPPKEATPPRSEEAAPCEKQERQKEEAMDIQELLDCGDDLMEIEQTAFMGSSKLMLNMIDNMLSTIDQRIQAVSSQ